MKRKGFTLVELLIVIAVLGALTAMMTLSSSGAASSAKAASIINGLHTMRTAVTMYIAENSAGNPTASDFTSKRSSYIDEAIDDAKFVVIAGTGTDKNWYAGYEVGTSDTNTIAKLVEKVDAEGLLGSTGTTEAPATTTKYAAPTEDSEISVVWIRVH